MTGTITVKLRVIDCGNEIAEEICERL